MPSLTNKYFHQSKIAEQKIYNSILKESIQIMGLTYYYLPRDVQLDDLIFGEDVISKFPIAIPIEMYMEDSTGFNGDKEMFSKFGLEIRNTYKLTVHKERWETEVKHQFVQFSEDNSNVLFRAINYIRPREGDLVYDPLTKFLMEIKFVDHDVEFFSLGKNYKYTLSCEAFQYQNEVINTGVPEIDSISNSSLDQLLGLTTPPPRQYGTDYAPDSTIIKVNIPNPFA